MKHKPLSKVSPRLSDPKHYELTYLAFGWFIAFFMSFIDVYSFNCNVLRFLTAYYIPLSFCSLIHFGIMILGITNIIACVIALFNFNMFSMIANPFSLSRLLQNQPIQQSKEPDPLSYALDELLDGSLFDRSSDNISSSSKDSYFKRKNTCTDVLCRSSTSPVHDIYTLEQLDRLSGVTRTSFAHKTFEPKVNKSFNCKYYASEEYIEEKNDLSQLDQSQLDILCVLQKYEKNSEKHQLEGPKRKHASDTTIKGNKRGRHSLSPSGTRIRSHQTYNIHTHSKNATLSRSPKFLKNQKPTVTSIAKLFRDDWHVSGDQFSIMIEDLRLFISKKIIQPLAKEIQSINEFFLSNNPTRNVSIGKTSIVEIERVFGQTRDKEIANIPYVLAYLRLHPNYSHFVKRILTWAQSEAIFDYLPDATSHDTTTWPLSFPRPTESLPTDSELIFYLFCHFMNTHCGLYPITYPYPCDLPFSRLHVLAENQQPSDVHFGDNGFYIEFSEMKPMSFKFHASRYPPIVSQPTSNVLVAILMLLVYGHGNEWYKILCSRVACSQ